MPVPVLAHHGHRPVPPGLGEPQQFPQVLPPALAQQVQPQPLEGRHVPGHLRAELGGQPGGELQGLVHGLGGSGRGRAAGLGQRAEDHPQLDPEQHVQVVGVDQLRRPHRELLADAFGGPQPLQEVRRLVPFLGDGARPPAPVVDGLAQHVHGPGEACAVRGRPAGPRTGPPGR